MPTLPFVSKERQPVGGEKGSSRVFKHYTVNSLTAHTFAHWAKIDALSSVNELKIRHTMGDIMRGTLKLPDGPLNF